MSKLIDADKLIEDVLNSMPTGSARGVFRAFIDEQPTAFDIDDILRQCKDKAIQLMNKQYNEDEHHMFSEGVQAMYLAIEKTIKAGGIDD